LKANGTLKSLFLGSNSIGDGVSFLADALQINTSLTAISLFANKIGDTGIKSVADLLSRNTPLKKIALQNNSLGPERVKLITDALQNSHSLRELYIGGNEIGNGGAFYIANLLRVNTTLAFLNIDSNGIETAGAIELANVLKDNKSLTYLSLRGNRIREEGGNALVEMLKTNYTIYQTGNPDMIHHFLGSSLFYIQWAPEIKRNQILRDYMWWPESHSRLSTKLSRAVTEFLVCCHSELPLEIISMIVNNAILVETKWLEPVRY